MEREKKNDKQPSNDGVPWPIARKHQHLQKIQAVNTQNATAKKTDALKYHRINHLKFLKPIRENCQREETLAIYTYELPNNNNIHNKLIYEANAYYNYIWRCSRSKKPKSIKRNDDHWPLRLQYH